MAVIPEFPCHDCLVNTVPLEAPREYYEIRDKLWQEEVKAPGIGQSDNGTDGFFLCIGCLERRIGRKLTRADFKFTLPANRPSRWLTDRLNDRLGPILNPSLPPREQVIQFFPCALWPAVMERYKPHSFGVEAGKGSYALGGSCEWPQDKEGRSLGRGSAD